MHTLKVPGKTHPKGPNPLGEGLVPVWGLCKWKNSSPMLGCAQSWWVLGCQGDLGRSWEWRFPAPPCPWWLFLLLFGCLWAGGSCPCCHPAPTEAPELSPKLPSWGYRASSRECPKSTQFSWLLILALAELLWVCVERHRVPPLIQLHSGKPHFPFFFVFSWMPGEFIVQSLFFGAILTLAQDVMHWAWCRSPGSSKNS